MVIVLSVTRYFVVFEHVTLKPDIETLLHLQRNFFIFTHREQLVYLSLPLSSIAGM